MINRLLGRAQWESCCGEPDGVAVGVAAVGDLDELVAHPQPEAGAMVIAVAGVSVVDGVGWEEADEGIGRAGPGVGHGDGDPAALGPHWAAPCFPDICYGSRLRCDLPIEVLVVNLLRGSVAERRVETLRIIAELDVPGHVFAGVFPCGIDGAMHSLDFQ